MCSARPWTMRTVFYRRKEPNVRLLEYEPGRLMDEAQARTLATAGGHVEMRHSALVLAFAVVAAARVAAQNAAKPKTVGGCPAEPAAFHTCALEKAKTFNPPRTPSGKPDLQGYWRAQLSQAFSVEGVSGNEPLVGSLVMPWENAPPMIVDPPDRKIPYQPWAVPIGRIGVNHNKYIDPRTACGSGGVPRLALQDPNQILQPAGDQYVLWLFEDHHVQRVIAMDGRPRARRKHQGDQRRFARPLGREHAGDRRQQFQRLQLVR